MNENRHIFSLSGITGMLIATVLLLAILAFLTVLAIGTQQASAQDAYKLKNPQEIQMKSRDNANHVVDAK